MKSKHLRQWDRKKNLKTNMKLKLKENVKKIAYLWERLYLISICDGTWC